MKWAFKSLAAAAAFVAAGSAGAVSFTLNPSYFVPPYDSNISDETHGYYYVLLEYLSGQSKLTFSPTLLQALSSSHVAVTEVDNARLSVNYKTNATTKVVSMATAVAAAPVQSLTGNLSFGDGLSPWSVNTLDGFRLNASFPNITTTGGFLEVKNLSLDLRNKKVYATLNGGNGVGLLNNVELWDVAAIVGPTSYGWSSLISHQVTPLTFANTLSGLTINPAAYNVFATALGLTATGKLVLSTVTDFGTISYAASLLIYSPIPEPTSYALIGAGLIAASVTARRRRTT